MMVDGCPWGAHAVGARVRWISEERSTGTVVSEPRFSEKTGKLRQRVLWDGSGMETEWSPTLLVPIDWSDDISLFVDLGEGWVYVRFMNWITRRREQDFKFRTREGLEIDVHNYEPVDVDPELESMEEVWKGRS